eukprot:2015895-Karenia_brevis.AAC.1
MDQVSGLVKEFKIAMSKSEEQLLDYSRGLSRRSKKPIDKGPNFPPMESPDSGGGRCQQQ